MTVSPKLLQIAIDAGSGSIGSITTQIGDAFVDSFGGKSYIAYHYRLFPSKSHKNVSFAIGNIFTFYFHVLWTRLFDAHGLASWSDTRKLINFIENNQVDIVHLHNLHGYYVNIKMLLKYLAKKDIPVVWTIHDCWNFTGHCAHFYDIQCDLWKRGCPKCPRKDRFPKSVWLNRSAQNFQIKKHLINSINKLVLVPVSDWQKRMLKESCLGTKTIVRVYNGVDTTIFKPKNSDDLKNSLGLRGMFIILGVATGWGPDKGTLDYIELSKRIPDDIKIVLVGITKELASQMPSRILCIPRTNSQQELSAFYNMADVLTSLSYQESMGLTPVEAMACGTPSIVYNNTAQPELVDEKTGIVVETGNIEEVLLAVNSIRKKGKESYKESCINRALELFDKKVCYSQYIEIYKKLLS